MTTCNTTCKGGEKHLACWAAAEKARARTRGEGAGCRRSRASIIALKREGVRVHGLLLRAARRTAGAAQRLWPGVDVLRAHDEASEPLGGSVWYRISG
jgi:hypothetical protein